MSCSWIAVQEDCHQRTGIAAGGEFHNVQPQTAVWFCFIDEDNNLKPGFIRRADNSCRVANKKPIATTSCPACSNTLVVCSLYWVCTLACAFRSYKSFVKFSSFLKRSTFLIICFAKFSVSFPANQASLSICELSKLKSYGLPKL